MDKQEDRAVYRFNYARLAKQSKMPLIAVYEHPADYPDKYVARAWDVNKPTHLVALADTLEEIRETIPKEMRCIGRQPNDDPCIVEVWI